MEILHEIKTSYTPQYNGLIEGMNGTIMNMTRRTLKEKKLSHAFWSEDKYHITNGGGKKGGDLKQREAEETHRRGYR